jgi:4'-phosphopantetheinyl transferase
MDRCDEVLLLLARPAELLAGDRRSAATRLLSPTDIAHVSRFRSERDRDIALASRATQRLALSAYAGQDVAPAAWHFTAGDNARPRLQDPPPPWSALRFSAANAIGLVGCAVCAHRNVGLDLELRRQDLMTDLLDRCLSIRERQQLDALPASDRPDRFTRLWTAKESYLKARGLGIIESLDQVEIELDASGGPALRLGAELDDVGSRWQLRCFQPTEGHVVTLCIERIDGSAGPEVIPRWIPLAADGASAARHE